MAGVHLIIVVIFRLGIFSLVVASLCGVRPRLHGTVGVHQNGLKDMDEEKLVPATVFDASVSGLTSLPAPDLLSFACVKTCANATACANTSCAHLPTGAPRIASVSQAK